MKNFNFILTILILLTGFIANQYLSGPEVSLPRKSLGNFPMTIGNWTMIQNHLISDRAMNILQVDDYIMRSYRNGSGEVITLYVGYFNSQREGKGSILPDNVSLVRGGIQF